MESASTASAYNTDTSLFKTTLVHALTAPFRVDASAGGVISAANVQTKALANGCILYSDAAQIQLEDPFNWDKPNYLPKSTSPALSGASFAGLDVFFTNVAYRGAFGTANWMTGWVSFDPQNNNY
jgi:hypothetical protein